MTLSMRQRIKEGMLFTDLTEGLPEKRLQGKELMYEYNHTRPSEGKRRKELIGQIFAKTGDNVWIGTHVVINPGVTIGDNSAIGAGSVVTNDIPANVIAIGVPCRVLREITPRDKEYYYHDLKVQP